MSSSARMVLFAYVQSACLKSRKSFLDGVSTGSGSDLVSDQHVIFPGDFDPHGLTRSLPLLY